MILPWAGLSQVSAQITFNPTFDANVIGPDPVTSFGVTHQGVLFDVVFTTAGDGGDIAWHSEDGHDDSPAINLASAGGGNTSTREVVVISRNDGDDFRLSMLYIDNTAEPVTVEGFLDGTAVAGSSRTVATGDNETLVFGDILVDEVRISSDDFFLTIIDGIAVVSDVTPPTVTAIEVSGTPSTSAIQFTVSFDEEPGDVSTTDFVLTSTGTASGNIASISPANANTVTVTIDQITGTGTLRLDVVAGNGITDISGNGGGNNGYVAAFTGGEFYTIAANSPPTVTGLPSEITVQEDATTDPLDISSATISDVDVGSGQLTLIFDADGGIFDIAAGTGITITGHLTDHLTLTGNLTDLNNYINIPSNIYFRPDRDLSGDNAATVDVSINDNGNTGTGGGTDVFVGTININITPVNDAPTVTVPATIAVNEDDPSALTGISFADVDAGPGMVTATFSVPTGALAATSGTGVSVGGTASALTMTGTIADINTFIASSGLMYTTAPNATLNVTMTVTITDNGNTGSGGSQQDSETLTLEVTAVNDAPTATNLTQSKVATEDGGAVALDDIVVTDVDGAAEVITATLTMSNPAAGSLTTGTFGSATSTYNSGTGSWAVTGPVADVNAALAAVAFTPSADWDQEFTITTRIRDAAGTGPADGTITVSVTAVNDAPVITVPGSITVTEDVPTSLTGISFADVDAGPGVVTATFSVPTGSLAATSGAGVTVGGTASALTMTGTIADINAFIASSGLTYTTVLNATADVTLTVTINDNGNTGTGGAQQDSETLTLEVTAVNDAPVNTVPGAQSVDQDGTLVFSTGSGNAISVADVDAGVGNIQVTLTATNGLITLGSTTGLTFTNGNGAGDGTMTFEGSITDVNTALNGLAFAPTAGYNGAAILQMVTDDLGLSGSGGSQTDTDVIAITVNPINPVVMAVGSVTPDGSYKTGDVISLTVAFDQTVTVNTAGGVPTLLLETGSTDQAAIYVSGSRSNTLVFNYTVQAGDGSADLDYVATAALMMNGATIRNASGRDAVLTLPAVGGPNSIAGQHNLVIDGVAPSVISVDVPANGHYREGDALDFTVNLSEAAVVNTVGGTPYLGLTIGTATVQAAYAAGSGSTALVFRYTVQAGDMDMDGIAVGGSLVLNGGTARDAAGNDAVPVLNSVGNTGNVLVNTAHPSVNLFTAATSPTNQAFTLTITFSEAVTGFTAGDITANNATVSSLQTSDNISYTALATPLADGAAGFYVPAGAVQNIGGNGNTVSNTLTVMYDGTAPAVTAVAVPAAGTYRVSEALEFTVSFSEAVAVSGTPYLGISIGSTTAQAVYIGGTGTSTLLFRYIVQSGDLDANGIGVSSAIALDGGTIRDTAGNHASLALNGAGGTAAVLVDAVAPAVNSVDVPAAGYYTTGDNLDFTVHFSEAITVTGIPAVPVTIGANTVNASYVSGSGSSGIVFRHTVQAGEQDLDGISLGNAIILDGGTLRDAAGNDAALTLNNVENTTDVRVYTAVPTVILSSTAASPVNGAFSVMVTFSEAVTGFAAGDITASNATVSNLQTADNITYTMLVTPTTDGAVSVEVPAGVAVNIGNNGNTASDMLEIDYDGTAPAAPSAPAAEAGDTEVTLEWAANTEPDLVSYRVYGGAATHPAVLLATVAAGTTTYTHTGLTNGREYSYRISAVDGAGNESLLSETATGVPMAGQTITFGALAAMTYGDSPLALTATASSGLEVSYSSSDPAVASVTGSVLTVLKAGAVRITASQGGNAAFHAATPVTQQLTINPAPLMVTADAGQNKVYGSADPALAFDATGFAPGDDESILTGALARAPGEDVGAYPITRGTLDAGPNYAITFTGADFSITPAAITGVTLTGDSFVYDGTEHSLAVEGTMPEGTSVRYSNNGRTDVGSQEVTATVSGANYPPLTLTATLTITPATRGISFPDLPESTFGDAAMDPRATASSGEEIIYTSSNPAVAEVTSEGHIRITGAGRATITATVPENGNYSSRPSVSQTMVVNKAPQTITLDAPAEVNRDAGSIVLEATASSGLPVTLSIDDGQVAALNGTALQILRLGTVRITATQPGDPNHEAAEPVTASVRVVDPALELPIRVHPAVSVNGDGINEFLMIEGIRDHADNRVTIISRNGTVVWEANGYDNERVAFRGIGTGQQKMPAGTYFYLVEVRVNGQWRHQKGYFVLRY
jgi:Fibronectin type III domain.